MPNLYDTILALIPTSSLGVGGLLSLAFDPTQAILGGSAVALFIVFLALFMFPPGGGRPSFMDNPALGPHQ
jgi:hypothetical protein